MTGGGFYVVSFVSCSSCFMLKFSGCYVIKLLGVWRAQAPPLIVGGAVRAGGKHPCGLCQCHLPHWWLSLIPFWLCFSFRSPGTYFVRRQWKFQGGFGPAFESELLTSVLTWATRAWKQLNSLVAVGLGYLWEEPPAKEECSTMEIKCLWRVHPPVCLPRKTCCDFFPATFVVKLRARFGLRDLLHLPMDKCLQMQSREFPEKLSKSKSRRVFCFFHWWGGIVFEGTVSFLFFLLH